MAMARGESSGTSHRHLDSWTAGQPSNNRSDKEPSLLCWRMLSVPPGFSLINRQGLAVYFRRFRGEVIWSDSLFSFKQQ